MQLITKDYCMEMTRYNAWQNVQIQAAMQTLGEEGAAADRGGFFGSILGTANHLLWADRIWMHRLAGWPDPKGTPKSSTTLCPTVAVWGSERFHTDGLLREWAGRLNNLDLAGELEWTSTDGTRTSRMPRGRVLTHMFNHQTHHRGQIHAMLTAAGCAAPVSDLILMPR